MAADTYNKVFTMHGVIMVFLVPRFLRSARYNREFRDFP